MCSMKNITAIIEPHRKGTKISIQCEVHGPVGHRFKADEATRLAERHIFNEITPD